MSDLHLIGPIEHAVRTKLSQRGLPENEFYHHDTICQARREDQINAVKLQFNLSMARLKVPKTILVPWDM
jgi:hypothetical protein